MKVSADSVLETLHAVMHLYRSLRHGALRDDPSGLTQMELRALSFFVRQPGATLSDLVAHSGRDKAQLARLIAGLKEGGYLVAQADGGDRRSVRLAPSAQALQVFARVQKENDRLAGIALRGLDADRKAQLSALLQAVRSNLQAELDAVAPAGEADDSPRRRAHAPSKR
ncbi:MarR family winged helix-turn-helix transcriptional regulator [Methyloversatilis thermotolerans]|uniref:MarR family winged helix-turn-helix transcriptional regulator n=1 Tax=Methyloversatilis thermotolerans TaxID=1346290 RepID=UPI0003756BD0|nr:helix-turn-helix domain-containing protein [Methyloversatilis thermotolerans]